MIIKFVDRSFNANNELCIRIWEYIANLRNETKFHFEINPYYLTKEQIQKLSYLPNDIVQLEVGIQTVQSKTLKLTHRKGEWSEINANLAALAQLKNIHTHFDMIVGLPGETFYDVKETFNEIIKLKPDHFQVGFLKILPGTKLHEDCHKWKYNYQETAPYRVFSSDTMSLKEMKEIELVELALELTYNSGIMTAFNKALLEQYYDPFKYFHLLGIIFKQNNITKSVSDKKRLFQLICSFLNKDIKYVSKTYLLDCLRFDWFLQSDTHYYPDFLEAELCEKFKVDFYVSFKEQWQAIQQEMSQNKDEDDLEEKTDSKTVIYPTRNKRGRKPRNIINLREIELDESAEVLEEEIVPAPSVYVKAKLKNAVFYRTKKYCEELINSYPRIIRNKEQGKTLGNLYGFVLINKSELFLIEKHDKENLTILTSILL
jgi:hypothetical protein